ncbi:MAG: hypothetical protein ACM3OH_10360 [Bacillota bacterium]|jgi:hypothetical protein
MRRQLLPLVLLALASACGDGGPTEPAGPVPGVLKIALATPNADDGALLFTVSGGRVSTVDAATGYQIYTAQPDTMTTRILVTGDIAAGEVVRIHVPDTRSAAAYHATIAQAASRTTFAQRALAGYALAVAP